MKIADLTVHAFQVEEPAFHNARLRPDAVVTQTLMRIVTDAGSEGYFLGGKGHGDRHGLSQDDVDLLQGRIRDLIRGVDPFDRERIWHWMWVANIPEHILSAVDCALWDLQGRHFGVPAHKLLGGARRKVKAYGSTYPNLGPPAVYAAHAKACQEQGYTHYKIHPYYFWDPATGRPDPGRPSHTDWDIEACRQVRAAVGADMTLSFDPWGTYRTYEEAVKVGRALEELDFYWYEHPMNEFRVSAYEKLTRELNIPILAPEIAHGSIYTPRRVDQARSLRYEPHRRIAGRPDRRAKNGGRVRGVRRAVRDPHERPRQSHGAGRQQRRYLRILRTRLAGARTGLRNAAALPERHLRSAGRRRLRNGALPSRLGV